MKSHPTAGFPAKYFQKRQQQDISGQSEDENDRRLENPEIKTKAPDTFVDSVTQKETTSDNNQISNEEQTFHINNTDYVKHDEAKTVDTTNLIVDKSEVASETITPLATAFDVTASNVSFQPRVISGKNIDSSSAKNIAKQIIPTTPIVQNAIVFESGKKPRIVKAHENVIVL